MTNIFINNLCIEHIFETVQCHCHTFFDKQLLQPTNNLDGWWRSKLFQRKSESDGRDALVGFNSQPALYVFCLYELWSDARGTTMVNLQFKLFCLTVITFESICNCIDCIMMFFWQARARARCVFCLVCFSRRHLQKWRRVVAITLWLSFRLYESRWNILMIKRCIQGIVGIRIR